MRALVVWLVLLGLAGSALAAEPAGGPPTFRDLVFGARLESLPDMRLLARYGDVAFYRRAQERSLLGEHCTTDIRYGFSRGVLFFVRLTVTDCDDQTALVRAYHTKYGRPANESSPGTWRLVWRKPQLTIALSFFVRDGRTEVDYVYLPGLTPGEREIWQSPQAIRADGPIGFRGLRFGRDIATLTGMTLAYREGAARYYRRQGDRMELGDIRLSDVLYGFSKGRFFAAIMRAPKAADFDPLHRAYLAKYGQPRAVASTLEEDLVWSWPRAQIALSRDAADGGLTIRYADADLLAEVIKAETAAGAPPVISGGLRLFAQGNPPRSFRGAPFGSTPADLPGAEYLYSHRGRKYYRRGDERLNLGDIPLSSVVYVYDTDKLASITLTVAQRKDNPERDFERVLSAYATKYGPPAARGMADGTRLFLWTWPGLSIAVNSPPNGPLEVHYVDTSLLRRREAALADKALDALGRKIFEVPRQTPARLARANDQE